MKKKIAFGIIAVLIVFFGVTGYLGLRNEVPRSKVGNLNSFTFSPSPNSKGVTDLTLVMAGGSFDLSRSSSKITSVDIQTNVKEWFPTETINAGDVVLEQSNRPKNNWQRVDYTVNDWKILTGPDPLDIKIDARIWDGTIDLTGLNLSSFQLADINSRSEILIKKPSGLYDTFVIDSARSNMNVSGLLNSGAKNVILKIPFGNYLMNFTGKLQQDMYAVVTTGFGKTRIEVSDSANAKVTFLGQTRKIAFDGDWKSLQGTTYVHPNTGKLLDIVVNSDQGDLEVVLVK